MLELISRARSKDRAVPLDHTLIGGVQPMWLVGPRRPCYKERERGRGTDTQDDRHFPLPRPDPIWGSAWPTGSSATATTTSSA